ncbi:hypothetical protein EV356DRAFT_498927 [Viridothelium virens]|uniref:SPRY domain-containing protein n=1 Tax=Viridothelium virens TaxID=1048519 RepID=A0A6A6HDL0_VIRVR|nr:hypothetical protein EV356DRAFT_498927 [Viridothelium virens]
MAGEQYNPPAGPPPSWRQRHHDEYAPPSGPPPSHRHKETFDPPPGPPPFRRHNETFAPPSGPPPSHHHDETFAPPSGPPPNKNQTPSESNPPPYHDWTIIPDTALLPPPPAIHHEISPTANASASSADHARHWTQRNPLAPPAHLSHAAQTARQNQQYLINRPREFTGQIFPNRTPGTHRLKAGERCADCVLIMALPSYSARLDSPLETEVARTIYFEVRVERMGRAGDAGIAVGFVALPYPTWRLPGWERGSIGVHGDDGRRYMNDNEGGKDFTTPWRDGETVGVGMRFAVSEQPPGYGESRARLKVEVFFTRNGAKAGGWDVHEEKDLDDTSGDVQGLEGFHDLHAAVGIFGGSDFQIILNPAEWKYYPE